MQPGTSLDGFIAKLNGDSDTWVNPADEERYQQVVERCGAVLVGRTTYEQYKEDFDAYENVMVFVCTSKTKQADTDSVKYVNGSAKDIVEKIESHGFKELVVCGGGEVNGLLASAGLVDEIVISIQPVVLGEGIPLFGSHKPDLKLELLSVNQDIPGVIQNHYKVIG